MINNTAQHQQSAGINIERKKRKKILNEIVDMLSPPEVDGHNSGRAYLSSDRRVRDNWDSGEKPTNNE